MDVKFCDVCGEVIKNLEGKETAIIKPKNDFELKMLHMMEQMQSIKVERIKDKYICTMELCAACNESFGKACEIWEVVRKKDTEGMRWK